MMTAGRGTGTMRPQSIIWFERLYVLSFVFGLASTVQNWSVRADLLRQNSLTRDLAWLAPASSIVGLLIAVAIWYLVARRGSVVAKWLVVLFAGWGGIVLALLVFGLSNGRGDPGNLLIGLVQNLAYIIAAVMLFQPDAKPWFGETPEVSA